MSTTGPGDERANVAVVGLGGIGGVVAGLLGRAGRHDIVACVRRPLDRLTVEHPDGAFDVALRGLVEPAAANPVDWVILCTKAHETASAAPWLARLCATRTRIAVLQNGIHPVRRVGPFAGPARVVPTVVYYNGERLASAGVRMRRAGPWDLAIGDDGDGRALAALLDGTGLRLLITPDLATLAWKKLLLNVTANPITALTMQRQSVLRRDDVRALCLAVLEEAAAVGRADGADLAADEPVRAFAYLMNYPPEAGTSMYYDRLAGRGFEVDALTGAVVAAGERHGVPTPLNRAFLALLRAISDAASNAGVTRAAG
ncbi:2-dehydropantoate 2-reductase [Rhodoplanes sp. TEM]|uniref:2-dehydropantoate 2-reductase n=1 Tax=Rhodoplanes tepidamans TaxID=200616 RepID=A0ABT5JA75_RHOTP|nr:MULTISPECIES: 2-dehydropantoate 2-reductase [Rhodoplanes]MDC7786550.1 2-dehydropantoate 2-reductase [Rhodoplanes tepidamans]MDC7983112.1 2-dehydropantoate 2-reductase [Rhodoplanes sp. TEM]MDQ0357570.1 2-dehydropantoate 2-reductase [Rhodoplanes tepidamans]